MASHASALKAHRQSLRRRDRNRSNRSKLGSALKRFAAQLKEGKANEARDSLPGLYALIDRGVQKKALSKNAAARHKSRLTKRLNTALAGATKE